MRRLVKWMLIVPVLVVMLGAAAFTTAVLWPEAAPPPAQRTGSPVAVTHVTVVDVVEGVLQPDVTVQIDNGVIVSVGPASESSLPEDIVSVNGRGKFLIPGLWDMHAHVGSAKADRKSLPLFLANGVTGIREMGGQADMDLKKQWDHQARSGRLPGPRFVSMAGAAVMRMGATDDALSIVTGLDSGIEFVKVFNGVLPEHFMALLAAAEKADVDVVGHRPRAVSAIDAANAGMRSLEHARLFLFEAYPGAADLRERYKAAYSGEGGNPRDLYTPKVMRAMLDEHDTSAFQEIVAAMARNDTWFCPTHITRKMDAMADDEIYRNDPRLKYISPVQRLRWKVDADGVVAQDPSPEGRQTFRDFHAKGLKLTGDAHRAGVRILAGSDANDTYCFPGFGLHDELQELVRAGLSPLDALRAATSHAAEFSGLLDAHGSIAPGKVADVVLLDENPLADIRATGRIHAVIFAGNLYNRRQLDDLLDYVESRASSVADSAKLLLSDGL